MNLKKKIQYKTKKDNITDYIAENYKQWGCKLEFVTNRSQEGSQFCRGFGGIGGLLRWKVEFSQPTDDEKRGVVAGVVVGDGAEENEDEDGWWFM
jgi:peptide chain release factor subunit 1